VITTKTQTLTTDSLSLDYLLPSTKDVLLTLANSNFNWLNDFVLGGASALAMRIGHRLGDDLEFFTYYDMFHKHDKKILRITKSFNDFKIIEVNQTSAEFKCNGVKVSFISKHEDLNNDYLMISRDDLDKIGAIKVLPLKETARTIAYDNLFLSKDIASYYDIYTLVKYYLELSEVYENGLKIIAHVDWRTFIYHLIYYKEVKSDLDISHLKPKYETDLLKIRKFLSKEIDKYIKERQIALASATPRKETVFNICKEKHLFWSYRKDVTVDEMPDDIIIEQLLIYGDIDDLILLFKVYPYKQIYDVWLLHILSNKEWYKSINNFLADYFFKVDISKIKVETRLERMMRERGMENND